MREWKKIEGFDFKEIIFEEYHHIAKITINRERYRNAFTPLTTWEMSQAFSYCRESQNIRVVILTGAGDKAFCAGGDMHVKGRGGYVGTDGVPRLNVLDVQMQIRRLPKPVIAMVNGYAIGGGHVLHILCDLSIAAYQLAAKPDAYAQLDEKLSEEHYAVGFKKGDDATASTVTETLKAMDADGFVKDLCDKYADQGISYENWCLA